MTTALFFLLAGFCGYLAMRLYAIKAENSELRRNVVYLKQRLNQRA